MHPTHHRFVFAAGRRRPTRGGVATAGDDVKCHKTLSRSRVLGMTPSEFTNLSSSERIEFRASLEAKYNSYREIANTPDIWLKLDEGDTELQEVTSIPLALLP